MSDPSASSSAGPSTTPAAAPAGATASLFVSSAPVPDDFEDVRGPNFEERQDVQSLIDSFARVGFQASGVHKAVQIIEKMVGTPVC